MSLVAKFETLLCHLNAEENDMALRLLEDLQKNEQRIEKLERLEAGGVDNWSGYGGLLR